MKPLIEIKGLSKRYRIRHEKRYLALRDEIADFFKAIKNKKSSFQTREDFWALRDLSFDVNKGEVVGIMGRNGAGKTTLLKLLSRITHPTKGEIRLRGRVASLLEVGTGFHPELTGKENIYFNGSIFGMKKKEIDKKFDEIVDFAGVEKFLDTPIKRYSIGMRLRLGFAVAAHLEPEILLIDEVLAVGDFAFQKKCLGRMGEVAKGGRTVLFVSHNMSSIRSLCSRGILLDEGNLIADGVVDEVMSKYLQSGIEKMGERVWKDIYRAPGNDIVRLKAVRTINQDREVRDRFDVTELFSVEIEFDVLKPGHNLEAGLYFSNEAGERIFSAGDFQSERWHNENRQVGIHKSICKIPANLLNEGRINIQAHISTIPHVLHVREIDALTIQIVDDFKPGGARGNYSKPWPPVAVRPLLEWGFEFRSH